MRLRFPLLLSAALLATLACDRTLSQARKTVYAPTEEGLTLIYEDPTLPEATRTQARLQLRVAASKETPQGRRVSITYTTLKGQNTFDFLNRNGSWEILEGNTPLFRMLPEGFPDRVGRWTEKTGGMTFHVIGRGRLPDAGLKLPEDYDRTGVWVELESLHGPRRRIFFLPGIGEVENQVLQDGRWLVQNRLVSRGFTDPPVVKAAP